MDSRWQIDAHSHGGATEPAQSEGFEARLLHLWSLIRSAWAGRWFMAGGVVAGLVAMSIYTAFNPPTQQYAAESQLFVRPIRGIAKDPSLNLGDSARNSAHAEVALLTSTTLLTETLNSAEVQSMREVRRQTDRLGYLRSVLDAEVGRDDGVIRVRAVMDSPTDAALLVNTLVKQYLAYHETLNRSTVDDALGVLNAERSHLEQQLVEQTRQLESLRIETGLLGLPGDELDLLNQTIEITTADYASIVRVSEEATHHAATALSLANDPARFGRFLEQIEGGIDTGPDEREQEVARLRARRAALLKRYGPRAPVIRDIDQEIAELEATAPSATPDIASAIARFDERATVLDERRRQLAARLVQQQKRLRELREASGRIESAQGEIERTREMIQQVQTRVQWAQLNHAAPPLKIAVLDAATPATSPVAGRHKRRMLEGVMIGLALGVALLFVHALVRRRLTTALEVQQTLGAPVIGGLPRLDATLSDQARGQYVLARGESDYAEACRSLRTALLFADRRDRRAAIAITSPMPGMGKSTVTSNLAVCIAQTGRRTLVVDADLRRPRQHRYFGIECDRNISDVLQESQQMNLRDLVHRTSVAGLDVLVCGSPAAQPSEIMTSRIFADAFEMLRKEYDIVLIDSPPLLSVTDAQVVAALADQTICVLKMDMLARPIAQSRRALEAVGASVFGAVINGTPEPHHWLQRIGGFDRYGAPGYRYTQQKDAA